MNKCLILLTGSFLAGILLSSCTKDEEEPSPDNKISLKISSASIDDYVKDTRVSENTNGISSLWSDGDKISVRIGINGNIGLYTLNAYGKVKTVNEPAYWTNTEEKSVTAWYPYADGEIDLGDQAEGLKYVLKAYVPRATYHDAVNLVFKHQLAKVRIKLLGNIMKNVTAVSVKGNTCFSTEGGSTGEAINLGFIKTMKASSSDGIYYEANFVPQTISEKNAVLITVGEKTYVNYADNANMPIETGKVYTYEVIPNTSGVYITATDYTIHTTEAGQITKDVVEAVMNGTNDMKVVGKVNQNDLNVIIGACKENIVNLDLSKAEGLDLIIPDKAFSGSKKLEHVSFPGGLLSIGNEAFFQCENLKGPLNIPNGVTIIKEGAFAGCKGLTDVILPTTLKTIQNGAFSCCKSLESIDIPASVNAIEGVYEAYGALYNGSFGRCSKLKSVTFHNGITRIGDHAFEECSNLEKISIPNSVKSIGIYAFYRCTGLNKVDLPNNLYDIDDYAFAECTGLKEPLLNEYVLLYYPADKNVEDVKIPTNIGKICGGAFYKCKNIKSINFSDVNYIGNGAFKECTGLTSINIIWVKEIGWGAFEKCTNLKNVSLPTNTKSLNSVFLDCTNLTDVYFTNTIPYLQQIKELEGTFSGCTNLQNVNIPESVETLRNTFNGCKSLMNLILPESIKNMYNVFDGCDNLNKIIAKPLTPPNVEDSENENFRQKCELYVPSSSFDKYANSDYWHYFIVKKMNSQNYGMKSVKSKHFKH